SHLRAGLDLLEDPDDLFLAELRLLHAELLGGETLLPTGSNQRGRFNSESQYEIRAIGIQCSRKVMISDAGIARGVGGRAMPFITEELGPFTTNTTRSAGARDA
ncbi:hypothetical protein, partial [Rhodanobacter sp. 7MK24]|uniref:hypothetical protein n=1 Tax=Rhodanobacter sp. 7MK24 TaxID=2775922 RepID=UPI001CE18695